MNPSVNYRIQQLLHELKTSVAEKNKSMLFNSSFGAIESVEYTGAGVTVTNPSEGHLIVNIPGGGGSGGLTLSTVEVNLGSTPRRSGKFNLTGSGLTVGKAVLIRQANGPYTNKGAFTDEAEMDSVEVSGKVTSATNIECFWRSRTLVARNFKFDYAVSG